MLVQVVLRKKKEDGTRLPYINPSSGLKLTEKVFMCLKHEATTMINKDKISFACDIWTHASMSFGGSPVQAFKLFLRDSTTIYIPLLGKSFTQQDDLRYVINPPIAGLGETYEDRVKDLLENKAQASGGVINIYGAAKKIFKSNVIVLPAALQTMLSKIYSITSYDSRGQLKEKEEDREFLDSEWDTNAYFLDTETKKVYKYVEGTGLVLETDWS